MKNWFSAPKLHALHIFSVRGIKIWHNCLVHQITS